MSRRCCSWISVALAAGIAVASPAAGSAAKRTVEKVRYSVDGARTRVVLDVSGSCGYDVTTHQNPERIAINIRNARAASSLAATSLEAGVVGRLRVNRLSWGTQVVLDLDSPAQWKAFTLPKSGSLPDRIVVDVFADEPATRTVTAALGGAGSPGPDNAPFIVAIDPGHGGEDPGTSGRYGLVEKKLALDIARRIAARINEIPGYKAVLTRDRDVYLTLPARTAIAAGKSADVFVSVHLNSAPNRSARGAEIFFISPSGARVTADRLLSDPGRAADELGLVETDNADILHMLVDVNQQTVMERSQLLAEAILESLSRQDLPPTRSVKQRSYSVLRTIEMPSVLVEAGFLTNPNDAGLLKQASGRELIADAIANGIVSYFQKYPPPRNRDEPIIVHKVARGESLWKISRKYGMSVTSLRKANKLENSSVLRVGQELIITNRY